MLALVVFTATLSITLVGQLAAERREGANAPAGVAPQPLEWR